MTPNKVWTVLSDGRSASDPWLAFASVPGGRLYRTGAPGVGPAMAFVPTNDRVAEEAALDGDDDAIEARVVQLRADKAELLAALDELAGYYQAFRERNKIGPCDAIARACAVIAKHRSA
jgi:hypothetical protein